MAINKQPKTDSCPQCYLENNITEPLLYSPGSKFSHYCGKGHEFEDREVLSSMMSQMNAKRNPPKKAVIAPVTAQAELSHDATVVQAPEIDQLNRAANLAIGAVESDPNPVPLQDGNGIYIDAINFARMSSLIGHFTDPSSLFGAIFALNQELADTRELLHRAEAAKQLSAVKKVNGDILIQVIIPERHAGPLNDIAEANQMDLTRYVNSRFEQGCDDMYFY